MTCSFSFFLSLQPSDCKRLIERLKNCSDTELLAEIKAIKVWNYGKSELCHWIDVLDLFDSILERGVKRERENQWSLPCDSDDDLKELMVHVIVFTALLIEHSFSRNSYNSMEHLTTLLSSSDMQIVLAVLNLLYAFSKRSNFISRLNSQAKQALIQRLNYLAEVRICPFFLNTLAYGSCTCSQCLGNIVFLDTYYINVP